MKLTIRLGTFVPSSGRYYYMIPAYLLAGSSPVCISDYERLLKPPKPTFFYKDPITLFRDVYAKWDFENDCPLPSGVKRVWENEKLVLRKTSGEEYHPTA